MKIYGWRYFKLQYILRLLICIALFTILTYIYNLNRCHSHNQNSEEHCDERHFVLTPFGECIPRFNAKLKFRTFANLRPHCKYVGDEIHCPDVRHHGETMVRQAQLAILRMFKILDLICKKHSIDYWLLRGSLLGAYRNKEMIPWDLDGDIGILYNDFERFSKIVRKELPSFLFYQDGTYEPKWLSKTRVPAKIRDRESCYTGCIREGCNWQDGIQIDIFIFKMECTTSGKGPLLVDTTYKNKLQYDHIFPLSRIVLDGIELSCPRKSAYILQHQFGYDYMKCPKVHWPLGFLPIPWYSCEYIENLHSKEKNNILANVTRYVNLN